MPEPGFLTSKKKPTALSIVFQGDAVVPAGVPFGPGVRCVGGNLKRLYVKFASNGSIAAPLAGDLSVSARSASLGDPIPTGGSRFYTVYYRDPIVLGACPAQSPFNATQGVSVSWGS